MSEPFKLPFAVFDVSQDEFRVIDADRWAVSGVLTRERAQWLRDRLNQSTTPPPAPAGEREAFEAAYVKVCGYPAATIANFWEPTQQYYMDDGLQSHWLLWDARASSPAPVLERRVPGGPACPTCGFKITVGKKPPFMSDDDPAPALELTAEDREQIRQARVRDPQVHREALSIHERDRRNLLAIIDRCFPASPKPALAKEFDVLADRAAVAFPEQMEIQHHACALLGRWALNHRTEISRALGGAGGDEWRGIETAPKDGTRILGINGRLYSVEAWEDGRWENDEGLTISPTHWRPLPAPPSALKPQGGEE